MEFIDEVIAAIESSDDGEQPWYTKAAEKLNADRITLEGTKAVRPHGTLLLPIDEYLTHDKRWSL